MNKSMSFDQIYEDFFGSNSSLVSKDVENERVLLENLYTDIEDLYLTDTSKEMLKKIINYIYNYKEDNIYVNFNIIIETKNKELVSHIVKILNNVCSNSNYLFNNKVKDISLYRLDNISSLDEVYSNNGIVVFNDLKGILLYDNDYNNRLLYVIKEHLSEKRISIITGEAQDINNLFLNDKDEIDNSFSFTLKEELPTSAEILKDILKDIQDINEEDKVKLLNYIENTFSKSSLDYPTYRDNLKRYIAFNKIIPTSEESKTNTEVFEELNELVGLEEVKKSLYDLVDLITLKNKTKDDLKLNNINLHMLFLGNPGTGKTTVARMLSNILYNLKFIRQNKLIEVSSKDLVAEYVGQTAPKTMDVINRALGGILFIDEAYSLSVGNNTYNAEAIATLIKAMEDFRDDLVVIFAGYTKEMEEFINSNSGIASRIGYTFNFKDYTNDELKQIFVNMLNKSGFVINDDALIKLDDIIANERLKDNFGNARFIRNVYEKTVINHASNTKNINDKIKLKTIVKEDIKYN